MDDVDARVREIISLMLSGQWHPGLAMELAAKYGVTVKAVQDWSRQAGRYLRFARGDVEYVRERLLANLDFAGRLALEQKRTWVGKDGEVHEVPAPDIRSFIAAQVEQGRLLRVAEPVREDGADEQVPLEQLAAALRAHGYEVKGPHGADERDTERPEADEEERGKT